MRKVEIKQQMSVPNLLCGEVIAMRIIDTDWIKKVLGSRKNLQEEIHEKMLSLYEELNDADERIRSASLPEMGDFYGKSSKHRDLMDVLLKEENIYRQQEQEIREIMWKLTEDLESINRIWVCYQMLGNPAYEILRQMYVEKKLYSTVEKNMGINHRIFEETRKAAVGQILKLYNSPLSNRDIIKLGKQQEVTKRKSSPTDYEQMTLELVPKSGTG